MDQPVYSRSGFPDLSLGPPMLILLGPIQWPILLTFEGFGLHGTRDETAPRQTLIWLSRGFAWREILTLVKPETLIRWHGKGFRRFWRWKSKARDSNLGPGIPDPPLDLPQEASTQYRIPPYDSSNTRPIMDGLHHEYGLERFAA